MIPYASQTSTRRNVEALLAAGWRFLLSPAAEKNDGWKTFGLRYCLDNGAWAAFRAWVKAKMAEGFDEEAAIGLWFAGGWREHAFDEEAFERLLELRGAGADWVVLPDIVGGGLESLALSVRWMNRALSYCSLVLIAVQDGMTAEDLAPLVGPSVGIFLGGSTEWKLAQMRYWGDFCAERQLHYHIARVNTARRFRMAHAAGAASVDGTSASMYADTLPLLDAAARQPDLLDPRRPHEKPMPPHRLRPPGHMGPAILGAAGCARR